MMSRQDRILYHQIHPLKLLTDWSTAPVAYYLLWRRRLLPALLVMFAPAIVVSLVLVQWADLGPLAQSPAGRYVKQHMTPTMQAVRFAGNAVMSLGAWFHRPWLLPAGLAIVLFGWFQGALIAGARQGKWD